MAGKPFLAKKDADDSTHTLRVKHVIKIALPRTVSKINMLLHFPQKYNIAAKTGRKVIFCIKFHMSLCTPCGSKISLKLLYLTPFLR